jgi:hypothetical protein
MSSKGGVQDRDHIWEAGKSPAKSHMRFSEGKSRNKSSELLVGYEEEGNGPCGQVDLLQNGKRNVHGVRAGYVGAPATP